MSISSKVREYPYNFKNVAYASAEDPNAAVIVWACNQKLFMRIIPPDDFLEWKNLHLSFSVTFRENSAGFPHTIPPADLRIVSVGVIQDLPFPITTIMPGRRIDLNKSVPNVSTPLEFQVDLSGLIDPTDINWVELVFPDYFIDLQSWGFITLFKLDALFTTEGIR